MFDTDGRLKLFNSALPRSGACRQHARREPAHRRIIASCRVLYDDPGTWSAISHRRHRISEDARADRRPDAAAGRQRHRLRGVAAARRGDAAHLRRRHRLASATSGRCSSATRRWWRPTGSRTSSSATSPTSSARRSPTSSASASCCRTRDGRRAHRQAARIPERHRRFVAHAAGHHQRHPRPRHHRCRGLELEARTGQGGAASSTRRCSACATGQPRPPRISTSASPRMRGVHRRRSPGSPGAL